MKLLNKVTLMGTLLLAASTPIVANATSTNDIKAETEVTHETKSETVNKLDGLVEKTLAETAAEIGNVAYAKEVETEIAEAVETYAEPVEEYVPAAPTNAHHVDGVPMIYQNAEGLPAGCEGTSLTMCLNYIGIPVSAWDTCMNYMPWSYDSTDIENVFIGNPSGGGYGCYVGCVINTAYSVMNAYGYNGSVINHTGDLAGMYAEIDSGYPVVIWGTDGWGDPNWGTYYSNAGAFTWWSNEHCLCLVGYSDTTVTIHDPYRGVVEIDRGWFEYEWANCGGKAVAVH